MNVKSDSVIRVLLVDDSPLVLHILQRLLSRFPEIRVAGTAANGQQALEMLPLIQPDVICTDLHMPVMDGLAFTRAVMDSHPRPILVVSVSVEPGSPNVFQLIEAGAVDVFPKPRAILDSDQEGIARELASRIRILAGVHVFRRAGRKTLPVSPCPTAHPKVSIVAIGASTGGPQALREILSRLPVDFPVPVVCVQHIIGSFLSEMVAWLGTAAALSVRKAIHGGMPQKGVVYFAPENVHLEFDDAGRFALTTSPPCDGHRPSVTVALRTAARSYGSGAMGVLLTGMGQDGVEGMASIAAAGGITIAQDEASSVVYGMPGEAVARGVVRHVLSLEQIAPMLIALTSDTPACGF